MEERTLAVFESEPIIFALFGNPVGHSLSPLMHQAAYREMGLNAVYVPFCVRDLEAAVRGIRGMDIRGVSVTIPFKEEVRKHLDEFEEGSGRIGAVNTVVNEGGRLRGYNTDWIGFVRDLKEWMPIQGRTFGVLGAGGAARAVLFGILSAGGKPVILNRTAARGEALAKEFGCSFLPLSEIRALEADCLVNTTSAGMAPQVNRSPVEGRDLDKFTWVVDIVYNPLETKLLQDARMAGCHTGSGLGMFVHQGAEQIRLWTGAEPPVESMKRAVRQRLEKNEKN